MNILKKAVVVCVAAGSLALAVPGIASAAPGGGGGAYGGGDFANVICYYVGAPPSSTYHGVCVSEFVRYGFL